MPGHDALLATVSVTRNGKDYDVGAGSVIGNGLQPAFAPLAVQCPEIAIDGRRLAVFGSGSLGIVAKSSAVYLRVVVVPDSTRWTSRGDVPALDCGCEFSMLASE